jgi:hypothetical protein
MEFTAVKTKLPDANPRTLFQALAPAQTRVHIFGAEIGLRGSTPATTGIWFDWLIQTSAGTSSELTGQKRDRGADESIQTTLYQDFTAEPTAGAVLINFSIHQQSQYPWRPSFPIIVKGGERVGLRYKSATYVEVVLTIYMEE